ncbi:MAG: TonB family protein [Bacteroidetes bacterium]|nr:TonB family protein [Bacteroidota bacterium]
MKAHQYRAVFLTLLIHAALFIMLMFLYITSQNPPWEEGLAGGGGGGSFVEFGTLEFNDAPPVTPQTQETTINKDDEIITSDVEETVAINQPEKKKDPKPDKKKDIKPTTKPVIKEPVLAKVEERKADPRSLYPGKKGSSGSPTGTQPGNGTGGTGSGNGGGNGDGTGTGSGGGSGTGSGGGNGDGAGIGFDLTGRNFRSLPKLEDRSQEQGRVVIEIIVDKSGNVLRADGPARGSTITNATLVRKSIDAAKKAKFSPSPQGVEEQKGSITFNFILR